MIKGIWADIILGAYLLITLFVRLQAEAYMVDRPFLSVALGLVMLAFLWACIKVGLLDPNYFGLLRTKHKVE